MKHPHTALLALAAAVLSLGIFLSLGTYSGHQTQAMAADDQTPPHRTITLSATGSATASPDIVTITTGVLSDAETAKDALAANTAAMTKVIDALKAAGLEDRDIQTSDFSVQPRYEYYQDGKPPKLTGYQVSNSVSIRVRDVKKLGAILDTVVQVGSNQIAGIQFEVSKAEELKDTARKEAIANATRMAKVYAEASGTRLGQVLQIVEGVAQEYPRPMLARAAAAADGAPVPIQAGEQRLDVQVTVTWALE